MSNVPYQRMKYVVASLETDREYRWLRSCRDVLESQVAEICGRIPPEERGILLEYWGISQEMMLRMVELACFADEL